MVSLYLDSSNIKLIVGLAIDDKPVDLIEYDAWQKQSEYMMKEIEKILDKNGIDPKDINEVVVTEGPGSYTGVRIALSIAKIYAYCLSIPLYLLSSLEVLKNGNKPSLCLINARSMRSFACVCENGKILLDECVISNNEIDELVKKYGCELCGDCNYLNKEGYKGNIFSEMIEIKKRSKPFDDVLSVKPVYLKN